METEKKESALKSIIVPVIVLVAICLVCSTLLAVLNDKTAPLIEENEAKATREAYLSVLPEGTDEASLKTLEVAGTSGVEGAVTTADGSAAVKAAAAGYSGKAVTVYVSFKPDGTIYKVQIDASTQTSGIGSKVGADSFAEKFSGWSSDQPVSGGAPVDAVSGATYSSKAAFEAVNAAMDCYQNEIKGAK